MSSKYSTLVEQRAGASFSWWGRDCSQYVSVETSMLTAPAGAQECSHGWSGGTTQSSVAEPVVAGTPIAIAPEGQRKRAYVLELSRFRRPSGTEDTIRKPPRGSLRFTRGYIPVPLPGQKQNNLAAMFKFTATK